MKHRSEGKWLRQLRRMAKRWVKDGGNPVRVSQTIMLKIRYRMIWK